MRPRTTWEKLAAPAAGPDPDEEPRVFLDAVLRGADPQGLRAEWPASAHVVDPRASTGWAFAAQAFLDSGLARPGARVACADPHAMELGALGIAAFHHAPAALHARALSGFEPLGLVRRILVHVNDRLPPGTDAVDLALELMAEAGPAVFGATALEFSGDAVAALDAPARRRLLAAAGLTGCLTATGPLDGTARQAWTEVKRPPGVPLDLLDELRTEEGAVHEELVVLHGGDVRPRALLPRHHELVPIERMADAGLSAVVVGGCIGGDVGSMAAALGHLERAPAKVPTYLVPASDRVLSALHEQGLPRRAEAVGATIVPPAGLPGLTGLVLATSPCLVPGAAIAAATTLVASAHAGRAVRPGSA